MNHFNIGDSPFRMGEKTDTLGEVHHFVNHRGPSHFSKLMEKAIGDMHMLEVLVYLDDLIMFRKTLQEHKQSSKSDWQTGRDWIEAIDRQVSVQPVTITYVGHIVSERGIATDPAKVDAVAHWKQPSNLPSLEPFLGFCGYYHHFIKNYSIIVRPLTELCNGYPQLKRR